MRLGLLLLLVQLAAPPAHSSLWSPDSQVPHNITSRSIDPRLLTGDDLKTPRDILRRFGYPHERYETTTLDGYVLQVDRIPNPGRPAVYLANPVISSAAIFLILGRGYSLGMILFDAGYDVWMSSVRGTAYSTKHVRLKKEDPAYWRFSFHEHGVFDHPACIDMVLGRTGLRQLYYVGYSMGATTFLVMTSVRPEYNAKIKAAFLMSPVTSLYHSKSVFVSIIKNLHNASEPLTKRIQFNAFPHALVRKFQQRTCRGEGRKACNEFYLRLNDAVRYEDYVANTLYFLETFPAGGSFPTFWHFAQQAFVPNVFRYYNYGARKNKKVYGRATAPNYPLHRITTPIYVYLGNSDSLANLKDFEYFRQNVRSVESYFLHPDPLFCHSDFVFSKGARIVYKRIAKDLARHKLQPC